jgi:hypothetical protein
MVVGVIFAEGHSAKKAMKRWPLVVFTLRLIGEPLEKARIMETTHFPSEPLFLGL